jgi:hypothetical protein
MDRQRLVVVLGSMDRRLDALLVSEKACLGAGNGGEDEHEKALKNILEDSENSPEKLGFRLQAYSDILKMKGLKPSKIYNIFLNVGLALRFKVNDAYEAKTRIGLTKRTKDACETEYTRLNATSEAFNQFIESHEWQ